MAHVPSYPSIYALGHAALDGLLDDPVLVEEKVDGSQFSFGILDGTLCARSKGKDLVLDEPEKMFALAVEVIRDLAPTLTPGWVYRCEYLQKPKHNTLAYARVPERHLIVYDVMVGPEQYAAPDVKATEARRLGLEVVPVFHHDRLDSLDTLRELAERESCLGGVAMEGVVLKNYTRFTKDKKPMMAKYVREAFKEAHKIAWRADNPTRQDVIAGLIAAFRTNARWAKAVQHLRDRGELTESPKDIGALIREVPADILKEHEEEIKQKLFDYAWPQIQRGVTAGLPQWYKDTLAAAAFEAPAA